MAPLLWYEYELHELTQIMTQRVPNYAYPLNAICFKAADAGSAEDKILKSCEIKSQ